MSFLFCSSLTTRSSTQCTCREIGASVLAPRQAAMSSPTRGGGRAVDKAAGPSQAAARRNEPVTPEVFHPGPAVLSARISSAAKTAAGAAAAGLVAARDSVLKLQQAAASPAGPFNRVSTEISPDDLDDDGAGSGDSPRHAHMGGRLASDTALAGLAEAAGHAWHDLPNISSWRQQVQLVRAAAVVTLTATLAYALLWAPNKLGLRWDLSMVSRLFYDNALAFVLFNLLGLFPFIVNCLMWPTLRSKGLRPAMWPHLLLSYVAGAFALLSYLARWNPPSPRRAARLPLARLTGDHMWLQRQHESRLMPAVVTASIATLMGLCWAATPATWAHFGFLFSHSKAIHVMLIDLTLLTLMSPWLVVADACARGLRFAQNPTGATLLGLAMLAVPMIGPGVYLLLRPITAGQGVGFSGRQRGRVVGAAGVPAWLSHVWPFESVTGRSSQVTAAAAAATGRAVRGARQLRDATAGAGSSAAAAGRSAAANVVAAAFVPLPRGVGVRSAAEGAAGAAGFATGAVREGLARGWARFKRGANWFLSGGYPHLATATRTGSMDEVFIDYDGQGGTDSSDSTEHQHEQLEEAPHHSFPAHSNLGRSAYFITSVTPGGGRELLFADDYNETEARQGLDDSEDDSEGDGEDDVTFDGAGGEDDGREQQYVRRGAYRRAKAVAIERLAELAHFEHPRIA